jgi:hemoglobin
MVPICKLRQQHGETKMTAKLTRRLAVMAISLMTGLISLGAFASDEAAAGPSLYERLGAWDGITAIVTDTVALHHENAELSHYFTDVDDAKLIGHVTAFFAAGTGGPAKYEGRDMTSAHASMNMSDADFDSAVRDVMTALSDNDIDDAAKAEVKAILESLRPAVMGTAAQ